MHARIFNRSALAAQDGWIHIVPKGELANTDAGVVQVLDDQSLYSIMSSIAADKASQGDDWPGIYAGREHFIYDADQDSAALAWFKDFQKRDDGIWANADGLTPQGKTAIDDQAYKFTSFVADSSDLQKLPGTADGLPRFRVMAIDTIGFTNLPNGRGMLTPISNRSTDDEPETEMAKAGNESAHVPHQEQPPTTAEDLKPVGVRVFNQIVALVRNRTGLGFHDAYNAALRDNRELFNPAFAGTDCVMPLHRLLNRADAATNLGRLAVHDCVVPKIKRVANRFFPSLNRQPLALQWDAVHRTAMVLDQLGVTRKLLNRADSAGLSTQDFAAANKQAGDVVDLLETKEEESKDFGNSSTFQDWADSTRVRCFKAQIRRLGTEQGMSIQQASDHLKETQPVFWAHSILAFDPDNKS